MGKQQRTKVQALLPPKANDPDSKFAVRVQAAYNSAAVGGTTLYGIDTPAPPEVVCMPGANRSPALGMQFPELCLKPAAPTDGNL